MIPFPNTFRNSARPDKFDSEARFATAAVHAVTVCAAGKSGVRACAVRDGPATQPITVRNLLTHTSGIQIFGLPNDFPQDKPGDTLATQIPKLAA